MEIRKYGRYWGVYDAGGALICVTVYRKGAAEVVKRLRELYAAQQWQDRSGPATALDAPASI